MVHHVDAWTYNPGNPGLFGMSAIADADKFPAARDAMLAEIEKMKARPVSAGELGKAVKQFISATLATRKTMEGQAGDLGGCWLMANDLTFSERYLAAVKRVRPADFQRVAREYLTPENRTLYALLPDGTAPKLSVTVEEKSDQPIQKFKLAERLVPAREGESSPAVRRVSRRVQRRRSGRKCGKQRRHATARPDAAQGHQTPQRRGHREGDRIRRRQHGQLWRQQQLWRERGGDEQPISPPDWICWPMFC